MKTHEGEKTYSCGKIWLFQKPRHLLFSTQLYLHFALVILWSLFLCNVLGVLMVSNSYVSDFDD